MNRLKKVRKEHGLTLKQLSKLFDKQGLLSAKANTLSQYENEKREPSIEALKALSEGLNRLGKRIYDWKARYRKKEMRCWQ